MRLLFDENLSVLSAQWAGATLAVDVLDARAAGLAGKADREVRRFAIETDRILVTLDADFGNLIRFLRPVPLESFGCGLDHQPKQTFGQFLQNGSTGSARLISMDNLPLSRKTSFGSGELLRSNRPVLDEIVAQR